MTHFAHCPLFAPLAVHVGAAPLGHASATPLLKSPVHAAQVPEVGSHVGLSVVQSDTFEAEHVVQRPLKGPAVLHAGAVVVGQTAPVPPWSAVHWAHVPVAPHAGVCGGQRPTRVGEHWVHVPSALHAGAAAFGHAALLPEPRSPLHAEQESVLDSHAGLAGVVHAAICDVVHSPHAPFGAQYGFATS